eukprot:124094-Pyramimonas_sp.AAC.1
MLAELDLVTKTINDNPLLQKAVSGDFNKLKGSFGKRFNDGISALMDLAPKLDGLAKHCKILMNLHEVRSLNAAKLEPAA